ncbi:hypothetical protein F0562_003637 [Nyssa sinensis]|uniref:Uncharacterized protein n=1 Tax=Nyssa sinensis TaxID=561372 RepID=A0A5J5BZW9_9ASTE|nr:hypothetical protein F0562_003637 [Nyssa sinensis]
MACLDMYNQNSEHKGLCAPSMSPRISFSNDFVESGHSHQQMIKHERTSRSEALVSSDFEFSVTNYSMMTADELFFKGRLLPFKDSCTSQKTTLRDELLVDDDDDDVSMRPPKGSTRWKELLGLKKAHNGSKKSAKNEGVAEKRPGMVHEDAHVIKSSQELNDGGSSCGDVEFGM